MSKCRHTHLGNVVALHEVVGEGPRVAEALKRCVHEARVAQVAQAWCGSGVVRGSDASPLNKLSLERARRTTNRSNPVRMKRGWWAQPITRALPKHKQTHTKKSVSAS